MTTTLVTFFFILIATVRVTRALVVDKISHPLRAWVLSKNGADGWWTFLIHCGWCTGFWVALPAAAVAWWPGQLQHHLNLEWWFGVPAVWFTIAYLTGLIITKENSNA